jgi:spermidine synthase
LGGGAMVHFLQHYDPQVQVTAVEIDPMVVQIAAEYFACRSGGNVRILTADGYEYLQTTESQYDVIYLDVFLKPTASTDSTGVPLRMKSLEFYRHIQDKLRPAGVIVFNLNRHAASDADIATTRAAFPQVYVFRPSAFNFVVVATLATERESPAALRARAQAADAGFKASFSFSEMLKHLTP